MGGENMKEDEEIILNKITMNIVEKTNALTKDRISIEISNGLNKEVTLDARYKIEKYNGKDWEELPIDISVEDILTIIPANETKELEIYLYPEQYNYTKGKYRIIRNIQLEQDNKKYQLKTEFEIGGDNEIIK